MDKIHPAVPRDDLDVIVGLAQNPALVGHRIVVNLLDQMLTEGHMHHALLFEGLQGVGKATLGHHLALQLLSNGEAGTLRQVDVTSPHWRQMVMGSHPGLLHISRPFDSKTQKFRTAITVEEIRKITHFLHQTASNNGWRIVMIDSADDMNRSGANALLKTLEEPPSRTLFILISHHKGRLLPTLRSRCHSLNFQPLSDPELSQILSMVAPHLKLGQSPDDDMEIIHQAQGSVRKALLLLQFGGLEIAQSIKAILLKEIFDIPESYRLASAVAAKDAHLQFSQFIDYLLCWVSEQAHEAAQRGEQAGACRFSCLYQQLSEEILEAQDYNLDKKHFVVVTLNKVHNAIFA